MGVPEYFWYIYGGFQVDVRDLACATESAVTRRAAFSALSYCHVMRQMDRLLVCVLLARNSYSCLSG
jgi:hypothetical protein